MLQYIADYIFKLYHFLTEVTLKLLPSQKTIPNNNIAAGVYAVINSERVLIAKSHTLQLQQ